MKKFLITSDQIEAFFRIRGFVLSNEDRGTLKAITESDLQELLATCEVTDKPSAKYKLNCFNLEQPSWLTHREKYSPDLLKGYGLLYAAPQISDKDGEIAKLVRAKLTSGNDVPVSRCVITREEIEAIDTL